MGQGRGPGAQGGGGGGGGYCSMNDDIRSKLLLRNGGGYNTLNLNSISVAEQRGWMCQLPLTNSCLISHQILRRTVEAMYAASEHRMESGLTCRPSLLKLSWACYKATSRGIKCPIWRNTVKLSSYMSLEPSLREEWHMPGGSSPHLQRR